MCERHAGTYIKQDSTADVADAGRELAETRAEAEASDVPSDPFSNLPEPERPPRPVGTHEYECRNDKWCRQDARGIWKPVDQWNSKCGPAVGIPAALIG